MLSLLMFLAGQRNAEPFKITVDTPTVQGEYYSPGIGTDRKPGILVVHGSEGSTQFTSYAAKELARAGYPSLAVRYFGGKGQPANLINVPLETLEEGLKWLKTQP